MRQRDGRGKRRREYRQIRVSHIIREPAALRTRWTHPYMALCNNAGVKRDSIAIRIFLNSSATPFLGILSVWDATMRSFMLFRHMPR